MVKLFVWRSCFWWGFSGCIDVGEERDEGWDGCDGRLGYKLCRSLHLEHGRLLHWGRCHLPVSVPVILHCVLVSVCFSRKCCGKILVQRYWMVHYIWLKSMKQKKKWMYSFVSICWNQCYLLSVGSYEFYPVSSMHVWLNSKWGLIMFLLLPGQWSARIYPGCFRRVLGTWVTFEHCKPQFDLYAICSKRLLIVSFSTSMWKNEKLWGVSIDRTKHPSIIWGRGSR